MAQSQTRMMRKQDSPLRERSKRVFGNADRLQVAFAVAASKSGVVDAQELHRELGISPARVRIQLLTLADAGLMVVLPRVTNVQSYERLDDPFWALVLTLVGAWDASDPG